MSREEFSAFVFIFLSLGYIVANWKKIYFYLKAANEVYQYDKRLEKEYKIKKSLSDVATKKQKNNVKPIRVHKPKKEWMKEIKRLNEAENKMIVESKKLWSTIKKELKEEGSILRWNFEDNKIEVIEDNKK